MSKVTSAHFTLAVDGQLPSIAVQKADGDLTAAGDAQGTASIVQLGQLIEAQFVLVGGELYIKGATGGFSQVPAALAGSIYDPSAILDPAKGVAKVESSVTNPTVTGTAGDAWLVSGTVPAAVVGNLVPGISTDVAAELTITMTDAQLPLRWESSDHTQPQQSPSLPSEVVTCLENARFVCPHSLEKHRSSRQAHV